MEVETINISKLVAEFEATDWVLKIRSDGWFEVRKKDKSDGKSFRDISSVISFLFRIKYHDTYDKYMKEIANYNKALEEFTGGLVDEKINCE